MTPTRLTICAATLTLLTAATAIADPAYVPSTVNLRNGAGTNNEIVAKIPGGSLVQVVGCADGWCEVEWQGKKGFSIATALDRSGRVPSVRPARVAREHRDQVAALASAHADGAQRAGWRGVQRVGDPRPHHRQPASDSSWAKARPANAWPDMPVGNPR